MSDTIPASGPTVDPKEIEYFNTISEEWWNGNELKGLHVMSKFWIKLIQDYFIDNNLVNKDLRDTPTIFKDKLILDIGCGGGIVSEQLAQTGATVTGVDINPTTITIAKSHAALNPSLSNLTYYVDTIEEHSSKNPEKYDIVVASFVLEHVSDHDLFLKHCIKCLKPGGSVFISCLSKTTIGWFVTIILYEYVMRLIPRGIHDWNKFITAEDTKTIIEKYNCAIKLLSGINYNFISEKWSFVRSTSIFFLMHAIKDN